MSMELKKSTGLRISPLKIPLERRLQTASVVLTMSLIFLCISLILASLFVPWAYPSIVAYLVWIYFDEAPDKCGRRFECARRLPFWRYLRDYFPARLIREAPLDRKKNYVFGYHPHGIIATGLWINFCTESNGFSELFPGIRLHPLTLVANLRVPFWREVLLSHGLCSVSRKTINYILNKAPGYSVVLVPGGAREALDAHPGINDLTLNRRKGFVKVALSNGADLVPVFSFGENDIFKQVANNDGSWVRRFQLQFLGVFGFAPCLPFGRGIFNYDIGVLPQRKPIVTVVGKPISVPHIPNPSESQVLEYHAKYVEGLQELYDKYKDKFSRNRVRDMSIIR